MNDKASCERNHQPYCSDPNNPLWYCCYSGTREGCQIQSITNSNHTLNCIPGTYLDYQIISGDTYYIVHDKSGMTSNKSPTSSWWSQSSTGTFDGSADPAHGGGAGCGTLANMPLSCTYGAAYWSTSQGSCGSLSGWVGQSSDRTHGFIQGTLYQCSSSNFTPATFSGYWTPYTYPHPLRRIIDHNAPAAPSGLSVN